MCSYEPLVSCFSFEFLKKLFYNSLLFTLRVIQGREINQVFLFTNKESEAHRWITRLHQSLIRGLSSHQPCYLTMWLYQMEYLTVPISDGAYSLVLHMHSGYHPATNVCPSLRRCHKDGVGECDCRSYFSNFNEHIRPTSGDLVRMQILILGGA